MAAAVPLPLKGAATGFSKGRLYPFSYLEPARAVIVRCPWSPSPLDTQQSRGLVFD